MAAVAVRNLSEKTHQALKARAKQHGVSTEAEIRSILDEAVHNSKAIQTPEKGLGERLREMGRKYGPLPDIVRDKTPARFATFE